MEINYKKVFFLTILSMVAIGSFLYLSKNTVKEDRQSMPDKDITSGLVVMSIPQKDLKLKNKNSVTKKEDYIVKRKDFINENPFVEKDIEEINEIYPYKSDIKPLSGYSFEKDSLSKLNIGDRINLPEINGFTFELKISKKIINSDGSVSFKATINGEDNKYFAVLTEGENSSFISLFSPEGSFELESRGDSGYVYDSNKIKNKRIDFNKTDVLIPKKK